MILIENKTYNAHYTGIIEIYTYDNVLRFTIYNAYVQESKPDNCYYVYSITGEQLAIFPISDTIYILRTSETTNQIIQEFPPEEETPEETTETTEQTTE